MTHPGLSAEDEAAIRGAVELAERESGAELVPVLAESSDGYAVADWRAAAVGAFLGAVVGSLGLGGGGWGGASRWTAPFAAAAGALLALTAAAVPAVRRALSGRAELDRRVDAAAAGEFLRHEVFRTRDRSGILIYVSLFERRVRVIADEGVYRALAKPAWDELANAVAAEMRSRPPASALLEAVRRASALVGEHGPRRRADDVNELPDAPLAT